MAALLGGVGPWPARGRVDLSRHAPTRRSLEALAASAARSRAGPGSFRAGWARRVPELPGGIPLAGYSARGGRPSTGQRDPIDVEALVVSDGRDHAAIVASDLLIVPPGVARRVRASVAERTGLAPDDLLLNASHTHSGPGAFAAGWLAEQSAGRFDAGVETALADAFVGAITEAWAGLEPARMGHGRRSVPEQVTNRTRPGGRVDADLQLLLVEQADGDRLVVACYAAH
ncbi:MAG: neutral/alkaline non-lysosomal ceramidase N-terminal domain-containing protein, partial [Deltaproteobacteria bacterium]|nr:neutral/alkaline non-lysosomal ceramidase N-terminal domain-containing protein [Deltaproteobacteria bacterium]